MSSYPTDSADTNLTAPTTTPTESDPGAVALTLPFPLPPTESDPDAVTLALPSPPTPTRHNPTESDTNLENPLPIFTPPSADTPLDPRQRIAISLLAMGRTVSSTAGVVGVHRSTLHEWLKRPAFVAELDRHTLEIHRAADTRLRVLLLHAIDAGFDSLARTNAAERYRHAFRLLSLLRSYRQDLFPTTDIKRFDHERRAQAKAAGLPAD